MRHMKVVAAATERAPLRGTTAGEDTLRQLSSEIMLGIEKAVGKQVTLPGKSSTSTLLRHIKQRIAMSEL
jgi:hypothetical protein